MLYNPPAEFCGADSISSAFRAKVSVLHASLGHDFSSPYLLTRGFSLFLGLGVHLRLSTERFQTNGALKTANVSSR
jgi:hypothetical protein